MAMSKKDYVLIASVIASLPERFDDGIGGGSKKQLREVLAEEMAYALEQENHRFDGERFVEACMKK